MVTALGAAIAAAMAPYFANMRNENPNVNVNNINNNDNSNLQAPARGAHAGAGIAAAAAGGAQLQPPARHPRGASRGRGPAAPPPAPPSPEAQLIAQLQRQVEGLQAELQRLRDENRAQRQQPQGQAPAQPRGSGRAPGGAAAVPTSTTSSPPRAQAAARAAGAAAGCGWMSWTNRHDETVHRYVHALPCTCGGNIPKGPPNPYRGGRPWDPSVAASTDTRQVPCYWTQDTYGVAWQHAGQCRGRVNCETSRPPPPRSLPPPTYTREVWDAVPHADRALAATAARWSVGLPEEYRPLTSGASPAAAASAAPAGGSSATGYAAAAASRARGAAQSGPQVVVAPRGGQAQPSARRARVVVRPAPQRPGGLSAPLQPTPQHLLRLLEGAPRITGVMSLSRPFTERDYAPLRAEGAQQIKPRGRVSEWPVEDKGAAFKELLVLGATAEEVRDIAGAALQQWEAVQAVSTVILVQSAAKAHCSVERLLRALNLSRADLEVQGGALHCQPLTHRGPWECAAEGEVDPAPPGHTLRIRWRRAADEGGDQEDQDMLDGGGEGGHGQLDGAEPPPLQDPQPLGGGAQVRVAITLDPQVLLGQGEKRRARGWTRATVQNFLREFVAPCDPSSYPMQEAGDAQGKRCEASVVLPLVQAQAVIRASGKHKGITCRPWMQGGDSPVPGGMLWVRLPASARAPLPDLWVKLSSDPQICGYFGGLIQGDQEGRVGIRFFGAQQVPQGVAQAVGDLLGAQVSPRKVVVRVGGYPLHYGLPEDGWAAFRQELPEVFGGEAGDVRIVRCEHLPHSGFARPRWDLTLTGVPEGWPGVWIPSSDSRGRDRVWEVRGMQRPPQRIQRLGKFHRVQGPPPPSEQTGQEGGGEEDAAAAGAAPMEGVSDAALAQRPDLL